MIWPVYYDKKRIGDIVWINTGGSPTPPPTPGDPYFDGVDDVTIPQGTDFDPTDGVKAYDGEGNEIPFTVSPDAIDACAVGEQELTYTAEGVTETRTITVEQIPNPTITGLTELTVEVGEEFDPLDGVSAEDGNGNPVEVTYEEPAPASNIIVDEDLSEPIPEGKLTRIGIPLTQLENLNEGDTIRVTLSNAVVDRNFVVDGGTLVFNGRVSYNPYYQQMVSYCDPEDFTTTPDYSREYLTPLLTFGHINDSMDVFVYDDGGEELSVDGIRATHILIERVEE